MKLTKLSCCIYLLIINSASCKQPFSDLNLNLELVQVVFRHGERTPQEDEAKLMTNKSISFEDPYGYGQLTNTGKKQEYTLGKMLRQRYNNFLGEYRPDHVYACSSDYDRTKASLQLVLAGLYPPTPKFKWSKELNWMPVPTHYLPEGIDYLFSLSSCERFEAAYEELMDTANMKYEMTKHEDIINFLNVQYPDIDVDLQEVFFINNLLNAEINFGIPLPAWYTPSIHKRITAAAKFWLDTLSFTPELVRLNGGSITKRFVDNMQVEPTENSRKIHLYSGHEFTVYAVAKAHSITLEKSPAFGSALILEKLRDRHNQTFVKMFYWTGVTEELYPISLYKCGECCPLSHYTELVTPSLPSDDELNCLTRSLTTGDLEGFLHDTEMHFS